MKDSAVWREARRRFRGDGIWKWALMLVLLAPMVGTCADEQGGTRVAPGQFSESTPRDCAEIEDDAKIVARIIAAPSGAPATLHPGVDLWVHQRSGTCLIRVHFGDRGDGRNSCLSFDECKETEELPCEYVVETWRVKELIGYLRERNCDVGRFVSWGDPILPWTAKGSNCGDAFVETLVRLDIEKNGLTDAKKWISEQGKEKWSYERGKRNPVDDYYLGGYQQMTRKSME